MKNWYATWAKQALAFNIGGTQWHKNTSGNPAMVVLGKLILTPVKLILLHHYEHNYSIGYTKPHINRIEFMAIYLALATRRQNK